MSIKCSIALHNLKMARTIANSGSSTHLQLKDIYMNLYNSLQDICRYRWPEDLPDNLGQLWVQGASYLKRGSSGDAKVKELLKILDRSVLDKQSVVIDVAIRWVWRQLQNITYG